MAKVFEVGDKYRPVVRIEKVRNEVATVLRVSGRRYVLDHKDQYQNTRRKDK